MPKLTDIFLKKVKSNKKVYIHDDLPGFCVQVLPSGAKTFYCITNFGKRRYINLGRYPDISLKEAREKYMEVRLQKPVFDECTALESHFFLSALIKVYLESYSMLHHSDSWRQTLELAFEKDVVPLLGDRDINSIRRRDIIKLIEDKAVSAPGQARTILRGLRGVFQYAVDREYLDASPCLRIAKAVPVVQSVIRDRTLTESEVHHVWNWLNGRGIEVTRNALKFILVTGQRPEEVVGIKAGEIKVGIGKSLCVTCRGCGWWTIPAARYKTGKNHRVYLTRLALSLLRPDGWGFPGGNINAHLTRAALSQLINKHKYCGLARWTPHDLRRTMRTNLSRLGVIREVAEAVVGHGKQGIEAVYNLHQYDEEKKTAMLLWERELLRLVENPGG